MFVTGFKYLSLNRCISGPSHHILAQQIVLITLFKKSCQPKDGILARQPQFDAILSFSLKVDKILHSDPYRCTHSSQKKIKSADALLPKTLSQYSSHFIGRHYSLTYSTMTT